PRRGLGRSDGSGDGAGDDADDRPRARLRVLDVAAREGEQREVAPHPHVGPGVDDRPDLPDEDVAGEDRLARVALDPAPLRLRVAPVARAPLTFLVCHGWASLSAGAWVTRPRRP